MTPKKPKKKKDPKAVARGRRNKRRGKVWERAVASLLRPIFGEDIHRGHQDNRGGFGKGEGADVDGSPFWIECKHEKQLAWRPAMRQAQATTDGRPIVVIGKEDLKPPGWSVGKPGTPPVAIMWLTDWLELVQDWHRLKAQYEPKGE